MKPKRYWQTLDQMRGGLHNPHILLMCYEVEFDELQRHFKS